MTKIKICGMTCRSDIDCVNQNDVDFAGFVMFFPKSKRNISRSTAVELTKHLDPRIKSVAVVVSPTVEEIEIIENCGFDYVQIHGKLEDSVLESAKIPILRAFNVSNMGELSACECCEKIAGYVFDAVEPGSGKVFDWSLVKNIHANSDKIILLAGGLNPENVSDAVRYIHPYGVDVSSGVENDSGRGKDASKVAEFVRRVRETEELMEK